MPRPRSQRSRTRRTRQAHDLRWANVQLTEAAVAIGGSSIFDVLGQFTLAQLAAIAKIVKVYIDFSYRGQTINLDFHGAFGLKVVTDEAMSVPTVPSPVAAQEPDASWYYIRPWAYLNSQLESIHQTFETRTFRMLPSGSTLAWVFGSDADSDGTVEYSVNIRSLLQMR